AFRLSTARSASALEVKIPATVFMLGKGFEREGGSRSGRLSPATLPRPAQVRGFWSLELDAF
ncbi:MAG TPA: hypothetical protein VF064_05695, partial [Pyrinomonadaceae bacterium]